MDGRIQTLRIEYASTVPSVRTVQYVNHKRSYNQGNLRKYFLRSPWYNHDRLSIFGGVVPGTTNDN